MSSRPLLIYDGDCDLCRRWIARWVHATGGGFDVEAAEYASPRFPEVAPAAFRRAVQLREPDGAWSQGADAVFRSLSYGGPRWPLTCYRHLPGFAPVSERAYRIVAHHRPVFGWLTRALWGDRLVPAGEAVTSWVFLRLLGLAYLVAFVSLGSQLLGLAGRDGILPARDLLAAVRERYGAGGVFGLPTVLWLGAGDGALIGVCAAGGALALALVAGAAPVACAVGAWVCYLSLANVCGDFLWFQWDSLLLETGFAAIFLAPWRLWSRPAADLPPHAPLRALRWLLVRLMIASAAVKLTSGDRAWRALTALEHYYETQPLPPWTAWYAHQFPAAFQKLSAVAMFLVEGIAPFTLFAPRRIRLLGVGALIALQILIAATGNYGFFNLLAIALCVLALDDAVWPRWLARGGATAPARPELARRRSSAAWPRWIATPIAVSLIAIGIVPMFAALRWPAALLGPLPALYRLAAPYRSVNSYGLFAVMTIRRPEIMVEGSADGATWRPYEFRWKAGDPARRPEFVAPHMPRLDWQLWFAALDDARREPWFLAFCEHLLRGSPAVVALLAHDPFEGRPPRFVRATLYDYRFTDPATRHATGAWWRREALGPYVPTLTLVNGRLAAAEPAALSAGPR